MIVTAWRDMAAPVRRKGQENKRCREVSPGPPGTVKSSLSRRSLQVPAASGEEYPASKIENAARGGILYLLEAAVYRVADCATGSRSLADVGLATVRRTRMSVGVAAAP